MKQLDDIADLLKMIKEESDTLIYRGQNQNWSLLPKIARNSVEILGYEDWLTLEVDILNRFINDVTLILEKEPKNKTEWLILGQHYGLPTRLLDWTTNPLKAAFFACEGNFEKDGYLYLLSYDGWYQDSIDFEYDLNARDFSVYFPKINNERMMLQEGCFTVFPLPTNTEKIHDLKSFTNRKGTGELIEIGIPASNKKKLLWELNELGINHKFIYSGIEGICKKICYDLNY